MFPKARRIAEANVLRAFPERGAPEREKILREAYGNLGEHLGDAIASLASAPREAPLPFPPESRAELARARDEGRGVLFISAHLGPWERVAATLVSAGFPLTHGGRESYDPRLNHLYEKLRAPGGVKWIYRGRPGAAMRMVRTLREGALLGMLMDLRSRVPSVAAPFLGHLAPTPIGPLGSRCERGQRCW